jgi:tetratricopeptide (TPR) repeat protein
MNADPRPPSGAHAPEAGTAIDEHNPWLGLVSFTEETRAFFFGRDGEVAELARRVQRKLLTVLFGKSGLGKTSILRAGLVPRLREHGYCPVYVRIAYGRDTPEPAEQIKEAIRRAASTSGEWTQAGVAATGESLWEFLHHRDDVLRDAAGTTLIPLLIFDQFEELFTLAQSDDFGRARAARFIEELADLVENRPPKALEAQLEADETAAERFDFARSDYRVLISLREDYLAPLEGLKKTMPSLSQNRLRLAPMTGAQALEAVLRPGRGLVSEEVAAAIVRFVAGGSELANAEVEPSLLSLICRELNDARLAQGRREISLDLLAGSHESILTNFYERSLADQPTAVRRVIEDELLTESGFRENVAEETLLKRFAAAGAIPGTLATLVNRRLLRIEERLDVRRVELTHDVLCGVVKSSRDQRHEREAREAAERVLAEQRAREHAARHALARARAIAIGCILLAVVALSAAVYAYLSAERARRAERMAQQSRVLAEQARSHAEQLLAYLSDDFERELESFGQLELLSQFTQRQIDYFHSLPPSLRSPETVRNGAIALIEHATAVLSLGVYDTGIKNTGEAIRLLQTLLRGGDRSEATLVVLGRGYMSRCEILGVEQGGGLDACRRAVAILRPLAERPNASLPARQAYLESLMVSGFVDRNFAGDNEDALRATQQAMQVGSELGARRLSNLQISADYTDAGAWRVFALDYLGRYDEALRVGKDVLAVADRVLEQRPWYRFALRGKELTEAAMAEAAGAELDPSGEMRFAGEDRRTARALLSFDPDNLPMLASLANALGETCDSLWALGHLDEALVWCRRSLDTQDKVADSASGSPQVVVSSELTDIQIAHVEALSGDLTGALTTAASVQRLFDSILSREPSGSLEGPSLRISPQLVRGEVAYERGDLDAASRISAQAITQLRNVKSVGMAQKLARGYLLSNMSDVYGHADYQLGHFAAAEHAERVALGQFKIFEPLSGMAGVSNERQAAAISTWLAMALARQGRLREAAQVIDPVVIFEQKLLSHDHGDVWVSYELACALYAQSLTKPARRGVLLKRAAALLDGLPPRLQRLHDVRQWRRWVSQRDR